MTALEAGQEMPRIEVAKLGGGKVTLGVPEGGHDWQMVVVYRGLHCPICKKYLATLEALQDRFAERGVDLLAISGDPEDKAQAMVDEKGLTFKMGYGLSIAEMGQLGL